MKVDQGLPEIPDRGIITIREEDGDMKIPMALIFANIYAKEREITLNVITARSKEAVSGDMDLYNLPDIKKSDILNSWDPVDMRSLLSSDLNIIENFSLLFAETGFNDMLDFFRFAESLKMEGRLIIILHNPSVFDKKQNFLVDSFSDGILHLTTSYEGSRARRNMKIIRLAGTFPYDRIVTYNINSDGFVVDTRERHG
ncbi:hypothetical protein Mpet_2640 [Methanolacinia petrolearia DSM 11571]|uniref:KaiC-like domain-containing protein n=1 Tax=Methanolacinia petrolearia (strain DSM 11571 / OCM 486 / SEBR 4847) TaxID=679926 RepID=E1RFS9_METP4|nr:hypothetical protein [Methanolacinia petrolearia]ADN37383.1 hypothetical protein Mpet_2640 [Methanolacinia petrolearia DSM 11571]